MQRRDRRLTYVESTSYESYPLSIRAFLPIRLITWAMELVDSDGVPRRGKGSLPSGPRPGGKVVRLRSWDTSLVSRCSGSPSMFQRRGPHTSLRAKAPLGATEKPPALIGGESGPVARDRLPGVAFGPAVRGANASLLASDNQARLPESVGNLAPVEKNPGAPTPRKLLLPSGFVFWNRRHEPCSSSG